MDTKFRSEGVAVADVNRDGKPDLFVGNLWYEAPNWIPREIRPAPDYDPANSYSNTFHSFAADVDRDGWTDQIVVGEPGSKGLWYRNPGRTKMGWAENPITDSVCNESPIFTDLDGDKRPELIAGHQEKRMLSWSPGKIMSEAFASRRISEESAPGCARYSHGMGVDDINGDGRLDVLCTGGFWTAPSRKSDEPWPFVRADLGPDCAHMYTHDFDGDGDKDVISSSAHGVGVWWHEQTKENGEIRFKRHIIDESFSQSHSMVKTDLNRDGQPDFVTGKRRWAHGPSGDVDPNAPGVLVWFEFRRNGGKVEWTRHTIDDDSGVGTQFTVADVNKDRLPDVVVSNKEGVFIFQQQKPSR